MDFSGIDGKTIAIVRESGGHHRVYRGTARCEREKLFGNVIRIKIDCGPEEDRRLDIIISENQWKDLITPDTQYGCDYCLWLTSPRLGSDRD